jgi:NADPH:quinone reductase-like Zn-dependent oxidoreductase
MFGISSALTDKKQPRILGMLAMLVRTPWFQFNPLSLINANKGVFGVNQGHLWGEIDRVRGWGEQLLELWKQGAIKPKIAQSFKFDEAAAAHQFIQDRMNIGKVLLVP